MRYGLACETMKWLTLNNSAIRESGDSLSSSWTLRRERKVVSCEGGQGTIEPVSSLQYIVTGELDVGDAFDATTADHIS